VCVCVCDTHTSASKKLDMTTKETHNSSKRGARQQKETTERKYVSTCIRKDTAYRMCSLAIEYVLLLFIT